MSSPILIIEAFYGGSHKQLVDVLVNAIPGCGLWTLPAKKWHWRARTAALYFAQTIPHCDDYKVLLCSSVLNLAELVALRPDLAKLRKIIYFHENQLVYPVRKQQERDFQYGYNQILASMVADKVLFNSKYNMESFLGNISSFLKLIPDHRPHGLSEQIRPKCSVLHFPIEFPRSEIELHEKPAKILKTSSTSFVVADTDVTGRKPATQDSANEMEIKSSDTSVSNASHATTTVTQACNQEKCMIDACNETLATSPADLSVVQAKKTKLEGKCERGESQAEDPEMVKARHPFCEKESTGQTVGVGSTQVTLRPANKVDHPLHIVWPHRWEHDKDPETFFSVLYELHDEGVQFQLSVLGETFSQIPDIFGKAEIRLNSHIINWGYLPSKAAYHQVLREADIVVSTAIHEFFGVAMLEAVHCGCYPLCPNRLVYPEIFPAENLYNTPNQLRKRLKHLAEHPNRIRRSRIKINVEQYSWTNLEGAYKAFLTDS